MQKTSRVAIGAEVRAHLARQGKKQKHLAAALGMTETTLSGRLNGHTPFDTDELEVITSMLGVTVADLFPDTPVSAA